MKRSDFLKTGFLAAVAVSCVGFVRKEDKTEEYKGNCETTNDILGPFYRPNAPVRSDLTSEGLVGHLVNLKGSVYSSDCESVLEDAIVEIWHCNTEGEYDNESEDFMQRGKWITAKDGKYAFQTILPGKYLNGGVYRPAHIHFRVRAAKHKELISQIYFQGDPHIEKDPWASKKKAIERILPISLEDTAGNLTVVFDIYLKA